jgi:hypothetical protein
MVQEVSWQREDLNRLEGAERPSPSLLDELIKGQMLDLELLPKLRLTHVKSLIINGFNDRYLMAFGG